MKQKLLDLLDRAKEIIKNLDDNIDSDENGFTFAVNKNNLAIAVRATSDEQQVVISNVNRGTNHFYKLKKGKNFTFICDDF